MIKKILKYTFLILAILLLVGSISLYAFLKNSAPTYEGEVALSNLNEDVEVKYDTYGIPHIYAKNAEDAYRALGYVHAQDRLFQMEMIRRVSGGNLAEILGSKLVDTDKFFRTLGIRKMAEQNVSVHFKDIKHDWQRSTLAYLEGVNNFIENGETPLEFSIIGIPKTKFDPVDVYSILGYMGLGFSRALKEDPLLEKIRLKHGEAYFEDWLLDGVEKDSVLNSSSNVKDLSSIIPRDVEHYLDEASMPLWYGSNAWVVSADRSSSGKVILCNDTHIGVSQPSVWYEAHISYPGFEFYGNHLAGVPFGLIGHTRELGWGLTIFPYDGIDVYREKQNPENLNQVWEDDRWVNLEIQNELIHVKDEEDIEFQRKVTRHGPVINDVASAVDSTEHEPLSFWWNFLHAPSSALEALYTMNYAKNIEDAKRGASKIDIVGLNVLYGDIEGNIAHWATGRIPKRPAHVNPKFILDGASGKDELLGFYPFEDNPQEINPEIGYIASANNDPGMVNSNYFPGYYCPPNRYERVIKMLESKEKWSQEDMKSIQLDVVSDEHKAILEVIVQSLKVNMEELSSIEKQVLERLDEWNGEYKLNLIEPTVYTKLVYNIMYATMVDEIGADDFNSLQASYTYKGSLIGLIQNENSIWWDDISTSDIKESRAMAIKNGFKQSIADLELQLGKDWKNWKWENVHTITHDHPLGAVEPFDKVFNVGPYPVTGGNDVPNKMMYRPNSEGKYEVYSSPALRILLDFANVNNSESINPTGQSGNVMSPHYKDQTIMFNEGIYRPQLMDKAQIDNESRTLVLKSNNE